LFSTILLRVVPATFKARKSNMLEKSHYYTLNGRETIASENIMRDVIL